MKKATLPAIVPVALSTKIANYEDMTKATSTLSQLNTALKSLTAQKELVTKPLNEALREERARFKPLEDQLNLAIAHIRQEMTRYQTLALAEKAKEEEAISKQVAKGKLAVEDALVALDDIAKVTQEVSTDAGKVKFRTVKVLSITNEKLIPREYLIIDEKAVLEALKADIKVSGAQLVEQQIPVNTLKIKL